MKHPIRVGDFNLLAQVAAEPFRPRGESAALVWSYRRKQPSICAISRPLCHVIHKPKLHEFGVDRNNTLRRFGLDPLTCSTVGRDVEEAHTLNLFDVGDL